MKYNELCGEKVSNLGFGTMRLPLREDKEINEELAELMIDLAIKRGVNYFDTAYPYHNGKSELILGKILNKYPRDSFFVADKYPGHQTASEYHPDEVFEEQLKKCGVDYFDFYLLHNVCENSMEAYESPKWGIIDYFVKQKELGRIRHLGFSTHATPETLRSFLEKHSDVMEFCQIQLNYLDYTLQNAKEKLEILKEFGLPVISMESIRGGKLAHLDEYNEKLFKKLRPWESTASWALRWLMEIPQVKVVLSGMSTMEQVTDNLHVFNSDQPLDNSEWNFLVDLGKQMNPGVPCTACGYCKQGCPKGLDIPLLMHSYNDSSFDNKAFTVGMLLDVMPEDKRPSACIECGACAKICPQKINIPKYMKKLDELVKDGPDWAKICKEREEAAKKLKSN